MWLLNHPPLRQLKDRYEFEPPAGWLEHLQKSAVSFGGASGSLVSADGLVLTNHHVGRSAIAKLSTAGHDLVKDGFYAATRDAELKCPDMELKVLWSIQDVTAKVDAATTPAMTAAEANTARRKAIISIEKESEDRTGLYSRVIALYHGARYHLYQSKRYTDIRLVFAPQQAIAFFGGDTDNFEYPRFDLDICVFRIYENGQPLHPEHYLHWAAAGATEGDLAFVFGHPGRTQRLNTVDHLKFIRDTALPDRLAWAWRRQGELEAFSARDDENARIAARELFGVENGRKAMLGQLSALQDPAFLQKKVEAEKRLRAFADGNRVQHAEWPDAWDKLAAAYRAERVAYPRGQVLNRLTGHATLSSIAMDLVQLAEERPKPNSDRLPEFGDARLATFYLHLYSPAPIYDALEIEDLASDLSYAAEVLGGDVPLVAAILAGHSPRERAGELVRGTKLKDVAERRKLADGGKQSIDASDDPLIRFAAQLDPVARAERKRFEDQTEAIERDSYSSIAAASFALGGEDVYPDATGTLRLAFGTIKGYRDADADVPPFTTFGGLYERSAQRRDQPPFDLPAQWAAAREKLNPATPFNFVLTADIIGGNSGSPVVDRTGNLIGLIFDGNLQSLAWDFLYEDHQARAIAVDARGIIEALRNVYDAGKLADELTGKSQRIP
jgi:hypothetical protein